MRLLALLLALATPSPSPSPSPTSHPLKTIVTVVSSPYCNALAQHFNNAFIPMHANDLVFEKVNVQLGDMNEMFNTPDYINQFLDLRVKMVNETAVLVKSLGPMQQEINALRESATLSNDPAAQKEMRDAAAELQDAYLHQFQLSTDLTNLAHEMMDYPITELPHPLNGWTFELARMPADEKNIKTYLHFDKQRATIDNAESRAIDAALAIAQNRCTK
jgi:hypothetical protein